MDFIPYKSNETLENRYYQIPQELFDNSLYKDKLNSDSKILYAFIIDRLTLSQKNNWTDSENNIYLIFTRQEVQNKLGLSEKTVIKAFKQLAETKLIFEKRQGLGKPNLIYIGKIQHEEFAEQENITEELKANNQLEWVGKMNSIKNSIEDIRQYLMKYNKNYIDIKEKIHKIMDRNLNIQKLLDEIHLEDGLSAVECKDLSRVIVLYNNLQDILEKEIYFKGGMDAYYYFKRIGVIR